MTDDNFWEHKSLAEMSPEEWEAVCDGCGQCCLHKLEDEDSGAIALTNVACRFLDLGNCHCSDYANRKTIVPDCIQLTPASAETLPWLPETCGYRLLARGQPLAWWHPLVSGDPDTVHRAGISVRDQAINEDKVADVQDHVMAWLNEDDVDPFGHKKRGSKRR
ncbi:MAG: YcgN family cysteine cluster protein [Alphaproteobacteria bacterium]